MRASSCAPTPSGLAEVYRDSGRAALVEELHARIAAPDDPDAVYALFTATARAVGDAGHAGRMRGRARAGSPSTPPTPATPTAIAA